MADKLMQSSDFSDAICRKRTRDECLEDGSQEISEEEFMCPICLQLLIEPVVMPCKHELCKLCFTQNVHEANLQCPICRVRISSWARKQARNGTLICQERWDLIQKLFPIKCERRLAGEDDEDNFCQRSLKRVLSENGAIRSEYEEEMQKIRKAREEEMRASEELIRRLMEEEEIIDPQMQLMINNDEELAKRLQQQIDSPVQAQTPLKPSTSKKVSKKTKGNSKQTNKSNNHTLDKWLSPTNKLSDHNKKSCLSKDPKLKSQISYSRIHQLSNVQKQRQEEEDFTLAKKLQEEFDKERSDSQNVVSRKKGTVDGYLLRQNPSESS